MAYGQSYGIVSPDEIELNDITPGDLIQGGGESTQEKANVNSMPGGNSPGKAFAATTPGLLQSPIFWITAVALLIFIKMLAERAGESEEFRTVRIGLENWMIVGLLAVTFIYAFKTSVSFIPSGAGWAMGLRQFAGLS
jgi:hypothetical protein